MVNFDSKLSPYDGDIWLKSAIATGLTQAQDVSSKKYSLNEMHTNASRFIERAAKGLAHA